MNTKKLIKIIFPFLVFVITIIALSIAIVYQNPLQILKDFFINSYFFSSSILYFILIAVSTMFSSITVAPVIPFVGKIFGSTHAYVLTFLGVLTGSSFSFLLAKKFGRKTIVKFFNPQKLNQLEKTIPRNLHFWQMLFFRFFKAPDALSYFLGLYSKISF